MVRAGVSKEKKRVVGGQYLIGMVGGMRQQLQVVGGIEDMSL